MPLTGREKATIFLSILGPEMASRVLRYLPEEMADIIASGIRHIPTPSPAALSEVLSEFNSYLALPEAEEYSLPRIEEKPKSRNNYTFLLCERPQLVAFLLHLLPEEGRQSVLLNLQRMRTTIEELLPEVKPNPLFPELEIKMKELFAGRLF